MSTPKLLNPQYLLVLGTMFLGWTIVLSDRPMVAQQTATDVSPAQTDLATVLLEKSNTTLDQEANNRAILAESLYAIGGIQQFNRKNLDSLRTLQRSYRAEPNAALLQEILILANRLRLKNEFVRYAEFSDGKGLIDQELILNAALALTEQRKYQSAISFYQRWLDVGMRPPTNLYLQLLIQIEVGRLRYLTNQFEQAAIDFKIVLDQLDTLSPNQRQQLLRNSATTYRMMANAFLKQGSIDLAEKIFRRANVDASPAIRLQDEAAIAFSKSEIDLAEQKVIQSISKENNNSATYNLLRKIFEAKLQDETAVQQAMVKVLSNIRIKFKTGKVLDERLVKLYIELGQTPAAREILLDQRNGTIYRDLANRKLLELAIENQDASRFLECLLIEVDEHENLVAIRKKMRMAAENAPFLASYRKFLAESKFSIEASFASELFFMHVESNDRGLNRKLLDQRISELESLSQKRKVAGCYALEAFATKRYDLATYGILKCQEFNLGQNGKTIDPRRQFENTLGLIVSYTLLGDFDNARKWVRAAIQLQASSASVSHLHAWLDLQDGNYVDAIEKYSKFLSVNDKPGIPQSLFQLIERAKLELALSLILIERDDLAVEMIKQAFDANPLGPDRSSFDRNNQRYKKYFLQLGKLIEQVKNGSPFSPIKK